MLKLFMNSKNDGSQGPWGPWSGSGENKGAKQENPKSKKTKTGGYLKDGFVVDSDQSENDNESEYDDEEEDLDEDSVNKLVIDQEDTIHLEDIGSELSEESYDYSDEELTL